MSQNARFLFEQYDRPDGRAVGAAVLASVVIHLPLLGLFGFLAPASRGQVMWRDATAILEDLARERRIIPVDLAELGSPDGDSKGASSRSGYAVAPFRRTKHAEGRVSRRAPEARAEPAPATLSLGARTGPSPGLHPGRARRGAAELSPERERRMRTKWFGWYRHLVERRLRDIYPKDELVASGVRGTLRFRVELAPDGKVKSLDIVRADSPRMAEALKAALKSQSSPVFPGYEETGLPFFPPFVFSITHGPGEWKEPGRLLSSAPQG